MSDEAARTTDPSTDSRTLLRRLLTAMEKWEASDVFVAVGRAPAVRVHGQLKRLDIPPIQSGQMSAMLDEVLNPQQRARLERTGDLDAGYSLTPTRRFRFNIARQQGEFTIVVRALAIGSFSFEELGLLSALSQLADLPRGLVLVTGATGSGKSTTMAALVHHINSTRAAHIVTIEEPIEFVHADRMGRITQREVGEDTESFVAALRAVVRQSPDVIVIGEMRDLESVRMALQAALTGHLVLATMHTIDAMQTLQRILTFFPEDQRDQAAVDVSLSLQAVVSQRLVPAKEGGTRALAVESLRVTPPARRLVAGQRFHELYDFMRTARDPNQITFNQSLLALYRAGTISLEIGRAYASNADEFLMNAQGMSSGTDTVRGDNGPDARVEVDVQWLLTLAVQKGASDMHVTVGRPPILRIDGKLQPLQTPPLTEADMRVLLFSILNQHQRSVYELERELDFALALPTGQRFRVNAYFQKGQMAAAMRAIPSEVPEAGVLNLPSVVTRLGERPHGLLLVVGPTGSGKSTTLACLVDRINRMRSCRIMTVEDPIEFVHTPRLATIDQREVGADTKTFAAALKYVLRQDPDVILVGEMRDHETMISAITAAETGHLVLATLHTNDAMSAIDRIIDVFPAGQQSQIRSQLAAALLGVVSQRLLARVGGGRVAAFEVMVATPAIRTLVRDNKMHQAVSMMEASTQEGSCTMDRSLRELVERGAISVDDAMRYVRNPKALGR